MNDRFGWMNHKVEVWDWLTVFKWPLLMVYDCNKEPRWSSGLVRSAKRHLTCCVLAAYPKKLIQLWLEFLHCPGAARGFWLCANNTNRNGNLITQAPLALSRSSFLWSSVYVHSSGLGVVLHPTCSLSLSIFLFLSLCLSPFISLFPFCTTLHTNVFVREMYLLYFMSKTILRINKWWWPLLLAFSFFNLLPV